MLDKREIFTTNKLYQSNLSEQLSIIANSPILVEYLRSGKITREKMDIDLLTLLSSLKASSIVGLEFDKYSEGKIFNLGSRTKNFVSLQLCYSAMTLDNKGGNCDKYNLLLFFSKKNYIQQLGQFNTDITPCKSKACVNLDMFDVKKFGSFYIADKSQMPVSLYIENNLSLPMNVMYMFFLFSLSILTVFTFKNTKKIIKTYVSDPIKEITEKLREKVFFSDNRKYSIDEINFLHKQIEEFKTYEKDAKIGAVATQVAHDVKSPLTTLNIMMRVLSPLLTEENRITLRGSINRIQDIANHLLRSYRTGEVGIMSHAENENKKLYLACEIETLISQKRIEIFGSNAININLNLEECSYALFVYANITGLNRVLSNLINNAIEALQPEGSVDIYLKRSNNQALMIIKDNGKGIPVEILEQIGQKKLTHGKEDGFGLGLYNAYQVISGFAGKISIKTRPEIDGTQIQITLPLVSPPNFFVESIQLEKYNYIVVLDDDQNIHNVWDMRVSAVALEKKPILQHLYSVEQVESWFFLERRNLNEYLFLIDYEILGSNKTGLDLIEMYELQSQSILVTSHYEEVDIQTRCENLGLYLLPKSMSIYIPLK